MRAALLVVAALWAATASPGQPPTARPAAPQATPNEAPDPASAEVAVTRAGCTRCHAAPAESEPRLRPIAGPALTDAARWHARDGGEAFLRTHHGGAAAADLAAWLQWSAREQPPLAPTPAVPSAQARGERLVRELACQACHTLASLEALATRTDTAHVAAFLAAPAAHRPAAVHDFALDAGEAAAIAAWLLRSQVSETVEVPLPGFAYEYFETKIATAGLPALEGLNPAARGLATRLDTTVATRDRNFALRFDAVLDVPTTGEWTFICGSDDSSWLWIDDELVVRNEAIAPHRRRSGKCQLQAGPHRLRVLMTQGGGGHSLEVLWRGPDTPEQEIPATRAKSSNRAHVPPAALPAPDAAAVQRGRAAAAAARCAACHASEDAALAQLPTTPAPAWSALRGGNCPTAANAAALWQAARAPLSKPAEPALALEVALQRDGCLACHRRDGRGGLTPIAQQGLAEVEDLGDEGRLPPDLTRVGGRLRTAWIERVLATGHKVRPYVRVRMPKLNAARAKQYAAWFAAVDGRPGDDDAPPFSLAQAELGQQLGGSGGRACIVCHTFAGKQSLGVQGMDLAAQFQRLRPAWFREWLLHPAQLRPGTRMPGFWPGGTAQDRQQVDAIWAWLSLGAAAPLPAGLSDAGSLVLEATERPRLHGAFLKDLSARCIAVATPLRTHYAYDVEHARLAWLWRGAFVDASGTWSGRAGQLLTPAGQDWIVLEDLRVGGGAPRQVIGRRVQPDGYPVFVVRVGAAEFEDSAMPRLVAGGSELERTLRCVRGPLELDLRAANAAATGTNAARLVVGDAPAADRYTLQADQTLKVVYRW